MAGVSDDWQVVEEALKAGRDTAAFVAPGLDETPTETMYADAQVALARLRSSPGSRGEGMTASFAEQHESNMRDLKLIREDPGWALSRVIAAREAEARVAELERHDSAATQDAVLFRGRMVTAEDRVTELTEQNERMALAISDALGRYQVTHIHEGLRQAMKDMP